MPAISLATVTSNENAASEVSGVVGPDDELIVGVGMRPIELARQRDEIEIGPLRKPLADRAGITGERRWSPWCSDPPARNTRVPGRDPDDSVRRRPRRRRGIFHLDGAVRKSDVCIVAWRVESNTAHAAPGRGERIGAGANEHHAADRRIEIGQKRRDAGSARQQPARCCGRSSSVSASPNVMLPSELTNATVCGLP